MNPEHPFAQYVRILGRGRTGTRGLSREEAREAFAMLLRGDADPLQVGAFLMLLRVKEETGDELAGFVEACRAQLAPARPLGSATLDWPSYAGKRREHPWYLLAALLLAGSGQRVFLHGGSAHTPGRLYTDEAMRALGLPVADTWQAVAAQLTDGGISYLSLGQFCPDLDHLLGLKPVLGLRSCVNTLTRMLNPLQAPYSLQSVFHPAYARLHREADQHLGQPHAMVFKGEAGEAEIRPHADNRLTWLHEDATGETTLPRRPADSLPAKREVTPSVAPLRRLWRGEEEDALGLAATLDTTAAALLLLHPEQSPEQAREQAVALWDRRDRGRLPACP
ncbi:glycosyl transferase family protein [Haliea atlantica]